MFSMAVEDDGDLTMDDEIEVGKDEQRGPDEEFGSEATSDSLYTSRNRGLSRMASQEAFLDEEAGGSEAPGPEESEGDKKDEEAHGGDEPPPHFLGAPDAPAGSRGEAESGPGLWQQLGVDEIVFDEQGEPDWLVVRNLLRLRSEDLSLIHI